MPNHKARALADRIGRDPELNELLSASRSRTLAPGELAAQRQSFVRAELAFGSDLDEARYREALLGGDATEIAKLDAEAVRRGFLSEKDDWDNWHPGPLGDESLKKPLPVKKPEKPSE